LRGGGGRKTRASRRRRHNDVTKRGASGAITGSQCDGIKCIDRRDCNWTIGLPSFGLGEVRIQPNGDGGVSTRSQINPLNNGVPLTKYDGRDGVQVSLGYRIWIETPICGYPSIASNDMLRATDSSQDKMQTAVTAAAASLAVQIIEFHAETGVDSLARGGAIIGPQPGIVGGENDDANLLVTGDNRPRQD